jgi:hypothetical protein
MTGADSRAERRSWASGRRSASPSNAGPTRSKPRIAIDAIDAIDAFDAFDAFAPIVARLAPPATEKRRF